MTTVLQLISFRSSKMNPRRKTRLSNSKAPLETVPTARSRSKGDAVQFDLFEARVDGIRKADGIEVSRREFFALGCPSPAFLRQRTAGSRNGAADAMLTDRGDDPIRTVFGAKDYESGIRPASIADWMVPQGRRISRII